MSVWQTTWNTAAQTPAPPMPSPMAAIPMFSTVE